MDARSKRRAGSFVCSHGTSNRPMRPSFYRLNAPYQRPRVQGYCCVLGAVATSAATICAVAIVPA